MLKLNQARKLTPTHIVEENLFFVSVCTGLGVQLVFCFLFFLIVFLFLNFVFSYFIYSFICSVGSPTFCCYIVPLLRLNYFDFSKYIEAFNAKLHFIHIQYTLHLTKNNIISEITNQNILFINIDY